MFRLPFAALALVAVLATGAAGQPPPPGVAPLPLPEGAEVLARGPVHESFAEPADANSSPTPLVLKPPPAPVEELPPDQKPAGDDVEWVAGYWHWDEERNDYIWLSGCWRHAPPGRDWLPGRWEQVQGGYHWVSGAWVPEGQNRLQLQPAPPAPVAEPVDLTRPPTPASVYVAGIWVWKDGRYGWRPGRWVDQPADWVWQPASYTWTPGGYLFVDGYWDRPLRARGMLFAPAAFTPQTLAAGRVRYEPQHVVPIDFLEGALFVRAASKHYFFGDYFEPKYKQGGFVPWTEYRGPAGRVDPLFAHALVHAPAVGWERSVRTLYTERYAGRAPLPPRTLALQQQYVRTAAPGHVTLAVPPPLAVRQAIALAPVRHIAAYGVKTVPVVQEHRVQYGQFAQQRVQAAGAYQQQAFTRLSEQHGGKATIPAAPYTVQVKTVTRTGALPPGQARRVAVPAAPEFEHHRDGPRRP